MRLIDADALIKAIDGNPFTTESVKSYIRVSAVKMPTIEPEPQWIPCSERLPKERDAGILKKLGTNKLSDDVLITVDVKGTQMTDVGCTHDGVWQWKHKYAFPDWTVIAWMPLPEPYREEGDNK